MAITLSEDQNYRGRGALINYRGYILYRGKGGVSFAGSKWTVLTPERGMVGVAATFKLAQQMVDERL